MCVKCSLVARELGCSIVMVKGIFTQRWPSLVTLPAGDLSSRLCSHGHGLIKDPLLLSFLPPAERTQSIAAKLNRIFNSFLQFKSTLTIPPLPTATRAV